MVIPSQVGCSNVPNYALLIVGKLHCTLQQLQVTFDVCLLSYPLVSASAKAIVRPTSVDVKKRLDDYHGNVYILYVNYTPQKHVL